MSAIPEQNSAAAIAQLGRLYEVRDPAVNHLLSAHPDLIPDLIDVAKAVTRYFGLDARLALETVVDPEEAVPSEELFAVITTTLRPTQALERLNAFDDGWWLKRSKTLGPRLTVTLD